MRLLNTMASQDEKLHCTPWYTEETSSKKTQIKFKVRRYSMGVPHTGIKLWQIGLILLKLAWYGGWRGNVNPGHCPAVRPPRVDPSPCHFFFIFPKELWWTPRINSWGSGLPSGAYKSLALFKGPMQGDPSSMLVSASWPNLLQFNPGVGDTHVISTRLKLYLSLLGACFFGVLRSAM